MMLTIFYSTWLSDLLPYGISVLRQILVLKSHVRFMVGQLGETTYARVLSVVVYLLGKIMF